MEVKWETEGELLVVSLSGRMDTLRAMELDDQFSGVSEEISSIVFDLEGLSYIASAGLRVLLWAQKYALGKGGSMIVKNVSPQVFEILETTGFKDYITIE